MAVLTNEHLTLLKHALRQRPGAREEMRSINPSKQAWLAAMQALEDGYNARRPAIKAEMDAAAGVTIPLALARHLEDMWMDLKARGKL